jgi:serine/threonine protein kinase/predicted Zn-dependent protease
LIGSKLAHYDIIDKIGSGGMGEVYKAHDTKLGRDIAIKILPPDIAADPERRKRFEREARSIAALKHPNIVTIYSVEETDGHVFLTMELVDGQTVSDLLPGDGLPLSKFFDIAIPLADAISNAHAAGITHRDLKPANIMIDADSRVKVLDFGLAKLLADSDSAAPEAQTLADDTDTQEGRVLGTVPYMSPEQAEGKPVDHRSDIFTLGIVFYEMVTGERPFKGDSSLSIMSSILRDSPSTITEVRRHLPVQLGRIVQHCLEKDPRRRFQSALDIANELEALRTEVSSATGSVEAIKVRSPLVNKKVGIAGVAIFVLVAALLIFKPFSVEIKPDQLAEAGGGNTLAIMYFDNLSDPADPKRYGEIVAELMITGLSESEHLRVVSSQRLYDILKQLGKEGEKSIDRSTATEVATRSKARWMMQGRILQAEPNFVITSQIVEVASGNVAASQQINGSPGETIFALVDRITEETLSDLSMPVEDAVSAPPQVADASTTSEEAYRYYLEGIEYQRKFFRQEARESFAKATEIDSTFAIAYFYLAQETHGDERKQATDAAMRHAHSATTKEQLYIEVAKAQTGNDAAGYKKSAQAILDKFPDDKFALTAMATYHRSWENDIAAVIEYTMRVIEIDPMDKLSYNQLAYAYVDVDDMDKAIWAINKYIELAPDEPNPYDTRGDIYARSGRLDDAIESYAKSVGIKEDFFEYASVIKLGHMYMFKGDDDRAAAEYRKLFSSDNPRIRARARTLLATVPAAHGKVAEAIRLLDAAIATDELEGLTGDAISSRYSAKAMLLSAIGRNDDAIANMNRCYKDDTAESEFEDLFYSARFAEIGAVAESQQLLAPFDARADSLDGVVLDLYNAARGALLSKQQDHAAAIECFERAERTDIFYIQYSRGKTYLNAGQYVDASSILEDLAGQYVNDRITADWSFPRLNYYLGLAYQGAGRHSDAIEQFEVFLQLWKDADAELPEPHDARERLADLKSSS